MLKFLLTFTPLRLCPFATLRLKKSRSTLQSQASAVQAGAGARARLGQSTSNHTTNLLTYK